MRLLHVVCFAWLTFLGCSNKIKQKGQDIIKPNVILVLTDDQGYGDIGAHGNDIIKTPNIDNLYQESYRLTDFHVGPTCAPTRSGLMTGRYANTVGVWHTVGGWSLLREREKTMANMFVEGGYVTGAFGKWHLGDNYPFRPEDRGFQETVMHGGGGVYQTPDYWGNTYFNDTYFHNGKPQKYKGYCTDVFFNEAITFIKDNRNKPFFCYIATNAPHGPYNVPVEYYNMYKELSDEVLTEKQKRFYGMITNVDDNLGKLRKTLKELDIADNTILIFMTDNGTSAGIAYHKGKPATGFNAGMRGTKGSAYEGGHRVPFFIHWKDGKISEAKDINELTSQLDVMPTLAQLCGIDLPKGHLPLDGESLVPFIENTKHKNNRMLIADSQRIQVPEKWRNSSVMQNKWRLIDGKELYNLEIDKGQKEDLASQYPKRVKEMRAFYDQWWKQVSEDFEEEVYFKIGLKEENPVALTAHDVHAPNGSQPWNQVYIREGAKGEGYWSIDVKEAGDYNMALRRYPVEADLLINTSIPGITKQDLPGLEKDIPQGENLNYVKATIKIGEDIDVSVPVTNSDKEAVFNVSLKSGKTKLNASFFNDKGEENVAYYVYIEKV
ncbi:arylsulfatase [Tamlana fucoidanivorans]|uniref:Arylsulfatase n=1 Tax=Allotamlana fucoidanivorans TaxID=2583814 RepID=A0A5C4SIV8_9FLAO|nr:arylsulfatase [Tamlana fucoidanivorans]TNJ43435.1 arylsulfatase [Tamlana fucoidanivorans]